MDSQTENRACQQPERVSRPISLGIIVFVADLFSVFGALSFLAVALKGNTWAVAACLGTGYLLFLLHELYKGQYQAWVLVQGLLGFGIIAWIAIYLSSPRGLAGLSFWEMIVVVALLCGLIIYLRGQKVKKFCSFCHLGRADKQADGQLIIVRQQREHRERKQAQRETKKPETGNCD